MQTIVSTRRKFLKTVATGAGAALAMPALSYGNIIGANDRVVVAVMGTNDRGHQLARAIATLQNVEVAYICDVDSRAVDKTSASVSGIQDRKPNGLTDFRKALEDPEIDALIIAAPDHWHAPATILACSAGKHVYVEKPASHNPREGELMVAAARKNNRVVQLGNQRRSWPIIIDAMEEIKSGVIGSVHYSRSWYARDRDDIGFGKKVPVPDWLNFDLWQGPAPRRDYKDNLIHYNWHWFWHWGTGEAGNNGVHTIDLSRWALGVDYPTRVTFGGGRYFLKDEAETPDTQMLTFEFEGGKFITWEGLSASQHGMEGSGVGVTFHGDNGTLVISGSGYKVLDPRDKVIKEVTAQSGRQATDLDGAVLGLTEVHLYDFVDAIRNDRQPNSEIEEGYKSTLLCHLGNISHRVGRVLTCDPSNGHIKNDNEAMSLWSREYEAGWEPQV